MDLPGRGGLRDPQLPGHGHGGAAAAVGLPDDLGFIGVHPLGQSAGAGQQLRRRHRFAGILQGQGAHVDDGVLDGDDHALDEVFQLTHVAGPVVLLQERQKPGTERERLAVLRAEAGQELVGQGEDILRAGPQRRNMDADHVEPVEKVGAEQAPLDLLFQVAVGGHQQPEIQLDLPGAGEALDGLFLNELQELGLDVGRQLADLVEKQRAVVGKLDFADLSAGSRAGESALFVAEQLRLNEVFVEHGAVDLDERPGGPVAHGVDGLGHGAFAHTRLARNQDVGLGVGGILHEGPQTLHGAAFEHQRGGCGPGAKLRDLLGVLLDGVLQMAVVALDGVDLLHGHGVEAHGVLQLPLVVKEGDAHGHDVFVGVVDGLGGGDLPLLADDLRRDAGGEHPCGLQIESGLAHDGVMGKAEVLFIGLADPQNGAVGVGEHHVIRQHQVVFRVQDLKKALEVDVLIKNGGETGRLCHGSTCLSVRCAIQK